VTTDVIDEVAADFRLSVVRPAPLAAERERPEAERKLGPPSPADNGSESNEEVWQAVKTLLQLHEHLQGTRSGREESLVAAEPEGQRT
jgi:hypothetical protein